MVRHPREGGGLEGDVNVLRLDSRLRGNDEKRHVIFWQKPSGRAVRSENVPRNGNILPPGEETSFLPYFP